MEYKTYKYSAIGQNNVEFDGKNRDSVKVNNTYIGVSDGHDSLLNFRAEIGAKFAVEVADLKVQTKGEYRKKIIQLWREKVCEHLKQKPFLNKEIKGIPYLYRESALENKYSPYGTNLAFANLVGDGIIYGSIGNNLILTMMNNKVEIVFTTKEDTGFNSYSLCDYEPEKNFKLKKTKELPDLIVVISDGIKNAYNNEGELISLLEIIRSDYENLSVKEFKTKIREFVDYLAKCITKDDATIAIMIRSRK